MKTAWAWLLALLVGCGPAPTSSRTLETVMRTLKLERSTADGVAVGMDLDGKVSTELDDTTCRKPDFTDPNGVPGIDNQLARLLPLIDAAGQGAIDALVQGAINEGTALLLMSLELRGAGGEVKTRRGQDVPLLGADGRILPGQTLNVDKSSDLGHTTLVEVEDEPGSVAGGLSSGAAAPTRVRVGPFSLDLPIVVFGTLYALRIPDARVVLTLGEDGAIDGLIAGGVPVADVLNMVDTASKMAGVDYVGLFGGSVRETADLFPGPDGDCAALSIAASFHAVQAFTF